MILQPFHQSVQYIFGHLEFASFSNIWLLLFPIKERLRTKSDSKGKACGLIERDYDFFPLFVSRQGAGPLQRDIGGQLKKFASRKYSRGLRRNRRAGRAGEYPGYKILLESYAWGGIWPSPSRRSQDDFSSLNESQASRGRKKIS